MDKKATKIIEKKPETRGSVNIKRAKIQCSVEVSSSGEIWGSWFASVDWIRRHKSKGTEEITGWWKSRLILGIKLNYK